MARKKDAKGEKGGVEKPPESERSAASEWVKTVLVAGGLFLVVRTFVLQTFVVISGSMTDSLMIGDYLVANRLAVGARVPGTAIRFPGYAKTRRGDVMVFHPHHAEGMKLVKRVAGLARDTLEMDAGNLFVNGERQPEPYRLAPLAGDEDSPEFDWQRSVLASGVDPDSYDPTLMNWGPLVVPDGHLFMLGDNRSDSYDSRYWGPLEEWRLEGRISMIYYSFNIESFRPFPALREIRWGRLGLFNDEIDR